MYYCIYMLACSQYAPQYCIKSHMHLPYFTAGVVDYSSWIAVISLGVGAYKLALRCNTMPVAVWVQIYPLLRLLRECINSGLDYWNGGLDSFSFVLIFIMLWLPCSVYTYLSFLLFYTYTIVHIQISLIKLLV